MMGKPRMNEMRRRSAALILALIIPFAGPSFGGGHSDKDQANCAEGSLPALGGDTNASGQIARGSELAWKIERRKKIWILTPWGMTTYRLPLILAEGIACRLTDDGEKLPGGAYNPSTLLPWSDIRAIKVRKNGIGIGALIGFSVGAALGSSAVKGMVDTPEGSDYFRAMTILGGFGALGGALIGALIPHWKTLYSAPAGSQPVPKISLAPARRGGMAVSFSLSF